MSTDSSSETTTASGPPTPGEFRLEVVQVPVSDVDRAKEFYEGLGWREDADFDLGEGRRVVQLHQRPHAPRSGGRGHRGSGRAGARGIGAACV